MEIVPVGGSAGEQSQPYPPIHIFMSFRGTDTRDEFASVLYDALIRAGLSVFMDDECIGLGEDIQLELQEGIRRSMGAIVILSKDFAASRWCLDELVLILERKTMMGSNYLLIPIYVDGVQQYEVRNQRGSFGKALAKRNKWYRYWIWDSDKVEVWRAALTEIAGYTGRHLKGNWSKFIDKIVEEIEQELRSQGITVNPPCCPCHPPRIDRVHAALHECMMWIIIGVFIFFFIEFLIISLMKQQFPDQYMKLMATISNKNKSVIETGSLGISGVYCIWMCAAEVLVFVLSAVLIICLAFQRGISKTDVLETMVPMALETTVPEGSVVSSEETSRSGVTFSTIIDAVRGSFAATMNRARSTNLSMRSISVSPALLRNQPRSILVGVLR